MILKYFDRQVWANSADPQEQSDQGLLFAIPSAPFRLNIKYLHSPTISLDEPI